MWYPTPRAKLLINKSLNLPATGNEQDWELELSDHKRLSEFISRYKNLPNDSDVKRALMALILSSFNDAKWEGTFDSSLWAQIASLIKSDYEIHKPILNQWVCINDDEFQISELVQNIITDLGTLY